MMPVVKLEKKFTREGWLIVRAMWSLEGDGAVGVGASWKDSNSSPPLV